VWRTNPVAPNGVVAITVDLRYANRTLSFDARVVHVMPGNDGRHGVALMFVDAAGATATLASTV